MTAYAYLRKSFVRSGAEDVSWDMQETAVRALAARYGDDQVVLLSDWDKSGRLDRTKRPGYDQLLKAIESGEAKAVYGYSLSRLARSVKQLASLIDLCRERGIPIRLDVDRLDTSTASGVLLANVLGSVAQFEADIAAERARGANEVKRARGERLGMAPYGDRPGEDLDVVLDTMREAGSFSGAARLLNARGVPPRNGKLWWASSVRVVVKRAAPELLPRGGKAGVRTTGSFALSQLLRCPTCGTRLTGVRDRAGRRVRYACRQGSVTPHPRSTVTESLLLPAMKAEASRLQAPEQVEETAERDRLALAKLSAARDRLKDAYVDGTFDKPSYLAQTARLDEQEAALVARVQVAELPAIDWDGEPSVLNTVLRSFWDGVDLDPETFQPVGFRWAAGLEEWRRA